MLGSVPYEGIYESAMGVHVVESSVPYNKSSSVKPCNMHLNNTHYLDRLSTLVPADETQRT
jgi:hypothetical protein